MKVTIFLKAATFLLVWFLISLLCIFAIVIFVNTVFVKDAHIKKAIREHLESNRVTNAVKYPGPWYALVMIYLLQTGYWFFVGFIYKKIFLQSLWHLRLLLPIAFHLVFFDPIGIVVSPAAVFLGGYCEDRWKRK